MKPELLQKIDQVFQSALDLAPDRRAIFLDGACAGDSELRREVESLLKAHQDAGDFIEDSASDVAAKLLAEKQTLVRPGQVVGQYLIEALLGAGGMGEVYLAKDKLGRKVALKLLAQALNRDESSVARFQQEARTLLALNHPNIVTIYDIGQTDTAYYIASELIEGETLRQRLVKRDIDLQDVLEIVNQIASALAAAHEKGIVHRDVKPENVMIRQDGYVKVLDFGIAKLTEQFASTDSEAPTMRQVHTAEGTVVGTAPYMSPEQARGLTVDARTDIWSLGVLLYETIAGRTPFSGDTTQDVIASVLQKAPPPLARYARDVPEALEWIVSKALRKDRAVRYQTAAELLVDLKELKKKIEFATSLGSEATGGGAPQSTRVPISDSRTDAPAALVPTSSAEYIVTGIKSHKLAVIICLLVLAAGIVGLGAYLHARNTEVAIESIAVLPFANQSHDPDTEYLSDGLTESIINSLTELKNLRVIPRSTVFRYKGKEDSLAAGHELGVRAVLTGRVTQRGDSLIVSAELVDVRDNKELWGVQYDRKLTDLVALQNEITRNVSRRLQPRLSGADEQKLAKNYTENVEAFQLYMKGTYFWNKFTKDGTKKAIEYFQQAIDIDPNYALAYVGLSEAYNVQGTLGIIPPKEATPKAEWAAGRAIALDDKLAEAHAAMAANKLFFDWDWAAAEREIRRALELNPNLADSHDLYAYYFDVKGRLDEAMSEMKRAQELAPLTASINVDVGLVSYHMRQYDTAIEQYRKGSELDPDFMEVPFTLGQAYERKGMYREAIAECQKAITYHGRDPAIVSVLGYVYATSGKRDEAQKIAAELTERWKQSYFPPTFIALVYTGLGDKDQAFRWLDKAYAERDSQLIWLNVEPELDGLRSDPRFASLVQRVGLIQ